MGRDPVDLAAVRTAYANLTAIALKHPELLETGPVETDHWEALLGEALTYSIAEAAELIGCHHRTIRRAIAGGGLQAAKLGRVYRISRKELIAWWRASGGGELFPSDEATEATA